MCTLTRIRPTALCVAVIAVLAACERNQAPLPENGRVIVVSIDGFRADYLDLYDTPALDALASRGVRAERLIPSFPTKTFPNHYTIATGLYPGHHGIIANNIWDPRTGARFALSDLSQVEDSSWWGGEPIWVTAERQGKPSASMFWPGGSTPIGGVLPSHHWRYDGSVPDSVRVSTVMGWMQLPEGERPDIALIYFSLVDDAGHSFGPESDETGQAVSRADSTVGLLLRLIRQVGLTDSVDVVVVSDHGMTPVSRDSLVFLDDYLDMDRVDVVDWAPVLALLPDSDYVDDAYESLTAVRGMSVYRKAELPPRFHYDSSDKITPIVGVMDQGWSPTTREYAFSNPGAFVGAAHGYDNELESMSALFIAAGPHFEGPRVVAPFENVDIYDMLAAILDIEPAPNDGDPATAAALVRAR